MIERFLTAAGRTTKPLANQAANPMTIRPSSERTAKALTGLLLGVVVWLAAAAYLPAQKENAVQPAAAPAKTEVKNVTPQEAEKLLRANTNVVVLDIRTPAEFAAGHLVGATNVDFNAADFAERLAQLDKAKPYLLHCATGRRSTIALPEFDRLHFRTLFHLNKGIRAWEQASLPVTQ